MFASSSLSYAVEYMGGLRDYNSNSVDDDDNDGGGNSGVSTTVVFASNFFVYCAANYLCCVCNSISGTVCGRTLRGAVCFIVIFASVLYYARPNAVSSLWQCSNVQCFVNGNSTNDDQFPVDR